MGRKSFSGAKILGTKAPTQQLVPATAPVPLTGESPELVSMAQALVELMRRTERLAELVAEVATVLSAKGLLDIEPELDEGLTAADVAAA